jgi:hypothetical protein
VNIADAIAALIEQTATGDDGPTGVAYFDFGDDDTDHTDEEG